MINNSYVYVECVSSDDNVAAVDVAVAVAAADDADDAINIGDEDIMFL